MERKADEKKRGGWRTLGIWVTLAFVVVMVAWYFLITVASEHAMEPVPLIHQK